MLGVHIRKQFLFALVLAVAALFILDAFSHSSSKPAFSSAEVKFADAAGGGMLLVPASCPSSPHYSGECQGGTPSSGCSLTASSYFVAAGDSVTLYWHTANIDGLGVDFGSGLINFSGTIQPGGITTSGQSGAVTITAPSQTTTYTYSGQGTFWYLNRNLGSFSCDATISVNSCPAGYALQNGQCVQSACPAGYTLQNGACVLTSCPAGYTLQNGACVNQCGAQFFCQGSDLYQRNPTTCNASLYQHCPYGCQGSACLGAPPPSIVLWNVSPVLVRSGSTVGVHWQAKNVKSCTITGTNGDGTGNNTTGVWDTDTGDKTSSPITAQTIYTITCQGLAGASPSSVSESTTVNIIPDFQEQ